MKLEKKYVAGMVTTVRTIIAFNLDLLSFSVILYEYCILYITAGLHLQPFKIVFQKF